MKILSQNVLSACISIDNKKIAFINRGLLLFVGFTVGDDKSVIDRMAQKISNARIFQDEKGLTNLSVQDIKGEVLSVSQFTLYGDMKKGNRPSFVDALTPELAKEYYEYFNQVLASLLNKPIATGVFGADMKVELINDGPFTLMFDSKDLVK